MTHNTMKKRLSRGWNISPREARLVLRECGYNYQMAETVLLGNGLKKCHYVNEELSRALIELANQAAKVGRAIAAGISAFGEAFTQSLNEEVEP